MNGKRTDFDQSRYYPNAEINIIITNQQFPNEGNVLNKKEKLIINDLRKKLTKIIISDKIKKVFTFINTIIIIKRNAVTKRITGVNETLIIMNDFRKIITSFKKIIKNKLIRTNYIPAGPNTDANQL